MANFVFVQGSNSVASKSRETANSTNDDNDDGDDDKRLNKEPESEEEKIEKNEVSFDQDVLLESITRFDSAVEQLERGTKVSYFIYRFLLNYYLFSF